MADICSCKHLLSHHFKDSSGIVQCSEDTCQCKGFTSERELSEARQTITELTADRDKWRDAANVLDEDLPDKLQGAESRVKKLEKALRLRSQMLDRWCDSWNDKRLADKRDALQGQLFDEWNDLEVAEQAEAALAGLPELKKENKKDESKS